MATSKNTMKKAAELLPRRLLIRKRSADMKEKANPKPHASHVTQQDIHPMLMEFIASSAYRPEEYDLETVEEANDFDCPESEDMPGPFENRYDVIEMADEYPNEPAEAARSAQDQSTADQENSVTESHSQLDSSEPLPLGDETSKNASEDV